MKLLLSGDAAPGASEADLVEACRRRALDGLELTLGAGHGHGVDVNQRPPRERTGMSCESDMHVPVEWLRLTPGTTKTMTLIWASGAYRLGAGLLLPEPMIIPPPDVSTALVHGSDPQDAADAASWAARTGMSTCWEVEPATLDSDVLSIILETTGDHLAHVRFLGAGPEAQASGAKGTCRLWSSLALRGYTGTVALAPSPGADLAAWHAWLFEQRGWGCNTAADKAARKTRAADHQTTVYQPEMIS